jgi:6-phosphogluconolactonase (cycloisomerase 2 family)
MVASKAFTLLVGAYSSVISSVRFDPSSSDLTVLGTSASNPNPSWITVHPLNSSVLLATSERNPIGGVSTFKITDRSKGVVVLASNATTGADPAYLTGLVKARQVAVMDVRSASLNAFEPIYSVQFLVLGRVGLFHSPSTRPTHTRRNTRPKDQVRRTSFPPTPGCRAWRRNLDSRPCE